MSRDPAQRIADVLDATEGASVMPVLLTETPM